MRWAGLVLGGLGALLIGAATPVFAEGGPQVWVTPGDAPGSSAAGDLRVGCEPLTIWAAGAGPAEGNWAVMPLAAAAGSPAHTVIGHWTSAGEAAAPVAEVGTLASGRYQLMVFGTLARERVLNVDCPGAAPAVYAPVVQPLAPTGAAAPVDANGDTVPRVELVAVHAEQTPPAFNPLLLVLAGGLLLSVLLIGWSFARR